MPGLIFHFFESMEFDVTRAQYFLSNNFVVFFVTKTFITAEMTNRTFLFLLIFDLMKKKIQLTFDLVSSVLAIAQMNYFTCSVVIK